MRTALSIATMMLALSSVAADPPKDGSAKLEQKLHGTWYGGDCMGDWTFGPKGDLEVKHYSPGDNHLTGTWELRWDALPPTLVMVCKTSDDPDYVGRTWTVRVLQLDDAVLAHQMAGQQGESRYSRTDE